MNLSDKNLKIAVIIPCFNEALTIGKVINDFRHILPSADIIVFDNNSTDDSLQEAKNARAIVFKEKRQGKGFVVNSMLRKVEADIYVMVDGDDTYPAEKVLDLIQPLLNEEADMVVGQRLSESSDKAYRPFHIIGNRLVCGLINLIFSSGLHDPMSGYRVFTKEIAFELPVVAFGFDVETEMTIQMLYRKFIIKEIPIQYRKRPLGSFSKLSTLKDGFLVIRKIFSIARAYKPLTFFGGSGILFFTLGILVGFIGLSQYFPIQLFNISAYFYLSISLIFIGTILGSVGIVIHTLNFRLLELSSTIIKLRSSWDLQKKSNEFERK
jgi:glycosyltransferase involved in cell wall biosynthesis